MSPIDEELRTTLRRRAEGLPPPADPLVGIERRAGQMRRRRAAGAAAGAALIVSLVAVAVPLSRDISHRTREDRFASSPAPSPSLQIIFGNPAPRLLREGRGDPASLTNRVPWPLRGNIETHNALQDFAFSQDFARTWARDHHIAGDRVGFSVLWESPLPDGSRAGIWQFWKLGTTTGYTVIGQRLTNGKVVIVSDLASSRVGEISGLLLGPHFGYVVVLGPPETSQIRYAADGIHFAPVDGQRGYLVGPGWAVFDWPDSGGYGPTMEPAGRPDRIELLGANGRPTYVGPIDVIRPLGEK